MQFPAAADAEGVLQIGCYATATHSVVDTDACMISKEANNAIMKQCAPGCSIITSAPMTKRQAKDLCAILWDAWAYTAAK
mgnify:CR=1 FL=1